MVGALRASPAAAGILGERLPRGAGALPGGVGGPATLAAGFVGKRAFRSGAGIESKAGEFYREGLEGSEKRAREAARSNGLLLDSYRRPDEFYRLKYSMLEERLEQVREIDGKLAYEKMRRAVEKASQEKASQEKASQEKARQARQVERARLEWDRQETARQSRDRRGPERRGPERDFGPSR